jgi:hypothetical protein
MHVERIHDSEKKKFEDGVLSHLAGIVQQHEPQKQVEPKSQIKSVGFVDAIKELLLLQKNKS